MNRITLLSIAFATFVSSTLISAAQIIVPTGLADGTQFRIIFVTDGQTNATSNDISYYNNFVTLQANLVPQLAVLGTTWTAIASTGSESVFTNTNTNPGDAGAPIYNLEGQEVAASNAGLWSGTLQNAIRYNQYGDVHNSQAWTGVGPEGYDLLVLGTNSANQTLFGSAYTTSGSWSDIYEFPPTTNLALYAISGVLTVGDIPTVAPEPSTWAMMLGGLGLLALCGRRTRRA